MIEQLAEHGVTAEDLVPSLATTYTVDNPEYDPDFTPQTSSSDDFPSPPPPTTDPVPDSPMPKDVPTEVPKAASEPELVSVDGEGEKASSGKAPETDEERVVREEAEERGRVRREVAKIELRASGSSDPFGQGDSLPPSPKPSHSPSSPRTPSPRFKPSSWGKRAAVDPFADGGDIGGALDPPKPKQPQPAVDPFADEGGDIGGGLDVTPSAGVDDGLTTPTASSYASVPPEYFPATADLSTPHSSPPAPIPVPLSSPPPADPPEKMHQVDNFLNPLPSSLPGVSKTLTAADKTITLDIRWTILCDLFLSLIADSVYDARSRVLLGRVADKLGLEWMDVVRFERRLTEALEIQESVLAKEHGEVLEGQRKKGIRQRYVMMGLATLGTFSPVVVEHHVAHFFCRRWTGHRPFGRTPRSGHRRRTRRGPHDHWRNGNDKFPRWCWRSRHHLVRRDRHGLRHRRSRHGQADAARQDVRVPASPQQQACQLLHHRSWVTYHLFGRRMRNALTSFPFAAS